jgi:hypothetical protein
MALMEQDWSEYRPEGKLEHHGWLLSLDGSNIKSELAIMHHSMPHELTSISKPSVFFLDALHRQCTVAESLVGIRAVGSWYRLLRLMCHPINCASML